MKHSLEVLELSVFWLYTPQTSGGDQEEGCRQQPEMFLLQDAEISVLHCCEICIRSSQHVPDRTTDNRNSNRKKDMKGFLHQAAVPSGL